MPFALPITFTIDAPVIGDAMVLQPGAPGRSPDLWFRPDLAAGTSAWQRDTDGSLHLQFVCPCGCGQVGLLPVNRKEKPTWRWDGSLATPSLYPSIRKTAGCGWHGWLTAGVWTDQAPGAPVR